MSIDRRWTKKTLSQENLSACSGKLNSYYTWQFQTKNDNCAHVFLCDLESEEDLRLHWENIRNSIAVHFQSVTDKSLERANFYLWFFVQDKVAAPLRVKIENDTYSSRKIVYDVKKDISEERKLKIIQNRLFDFRTPLLSDRKELCLKNIELCNFRSYHKFHTIDLNGIDGEPARLVVLYAPNGTGKTSIFDAIEWSLTGTIDRFENLSNKESGQILKNTHAGPNEKSYVRLAFTDQNFVKAQVTTVSGNTKKDYTPGAKRETSDFLRKLVYQTESECKDNPKHNRTVKSEWKKIFMSHDRIDNFISAGNPEEWFQEWGDLWDINGEQRSHLKNARDTLVELQKEQKKDTTALKAIQKEIESYCLLQDSLTLQQEQISAYNKITEWDYLDTPDFKAITEQEYLQWTDRVESTQNTLAMEKQNTEEAMGYLNNHVEADLMEYRGRATEIQQQTNIRNEYKKNIQDIQAREKLQTQIKDLRDKQSELDLKRNLLFRATEQGEERYSQLIQAHKDYLVLSDLKKESSDTTIAIKTIEEKVKYLDDKKATTTNQLLNYSMVLKDLNEVKSTKEMRLAIETEDLQKQQVVYIEQKQRLSYLENEINSLSLIKNKLLELNITESLQHNKKYLNELLYKFDTIQSLTDLKNIDLDSSLVVFVEIEKIFPDNSQKNLHKNLIEYMYALRDISETYENYRKHISTLSFLNQAKEQFCQLIQEEKISICPLCQQKYDNWEVLLNTIQTAADDQVEVGMRFRDITSKASTLGRIISKEFEDYLALIRNEIKTLQTQKTQVGADYMLLEVKVNALEEKVQIEKDLIDSYTKEQEKTIKMMDTAQMNLSDIEKETLELQSKLQNLKQSLEENKGKIDHTNQKLLDLGVYKIPDFASMLEAIAGLSYNEAIIETEKLTNLYNNNLIRSKEYQQNLLELSVSSESNEDYNLLLSKAEQTLQLLINEQTESKKMIIRHLYGNQEERGKVFTQLEFLSNVNKELSKQIKVLQKKASTLSDCCEILNSLRYNQAYLNYYQNSANLNNKAEELQVRIKEREDSEIPEAESRLSSIQMELEKKMEAFLKQENANDIYEKLNPHDTLKQLKCAFSFDENNRPLLSFKTISRKGRKYAPEWYFSAAQLNIVAFSLFLGKALMLDTDSVPAGTIMIDDPIGHFDDINVLGFVDLLRTIIETSGRQIIISTHESRIFRLLQRKIPDSEYPVKYLDCRDIILDAKEVPDE